VSGVGDQFDALNKELVDVKELVTLDSQERATEFSLLRQQVQDQSDALETQRRTLASLSKKLEEANADIRSNLEYRKRNNMEVLELKKRIQQLSEPSSTASDGV
jgi:chromosome segregation ATPase